MGIAKRRVEGEVQVCVVCLDGACFLFPGFLDVQLLHNVIEREWQLSHRAAKAHRNSNLCPLNCLCEEFCHAQLIVVKNQLPLFTEQNAMVA